MAQPAHARGRPRRRPDRRDSSSPLIDRRVCGRVGDIDGRVSFWSRAHLTLITQVQVGEMPERYVHTRNMVGLAGLGARRVRRKECFLFLCEDEGRGPASRIVQLEQ